MSRNHAHPITKTHNYNANHIIFSITTPILFLSGSRESRTQHHKNSIKRNKIGKFLSGNDQYEAFYKMCQVESEEKGT